MIDGQPPQAVLQYRGKNFDASAVETFLYDWWEASGFFTPGPETPGGHGGEMLWRRTPRGN